MKWFSQHADACVYAKQTLGMIVVFYKEGWIVGDRNTINALKSNKSIPPKQTDLHVESDANAQPYLHDDTFIFNSAAWNAYLDAKKHDEEQQGYR